MGYVYAKREEATPHEVKKGQTLAGIAKQHMGSDGAPPDLIWQELALFNWATDAEAEVTLALCERIGSSDFEAVRKGADPGALTLDPDFGPSTPGVILIPKLWKSEELPLDKKYTISVEKRKKATTIDIKALDKWFIPVKETCDLTYAGASDPACADEVHLEVYASNYCKLKAWNDGLPTFDALDGIAIYQSKREVGETSIGDWRGLSSCDTGALSPKDHPLNVAFSPYTAVMRYSKAGKDKTARIDLDPFWVAFGEDDQPLPDTCKVAWALKNAEKIKVGLLQIYNGAGEVVFAKGLDQSDLESGKFDAKDKVEFKRERMPYRVSIEAHRDVNKSEGLALAAMHTEVRLFVHEDTHPGEKKNYTAADNRISIDLGLADVYHKDKKLEPTDGSLWTKYKLALAGFHPGPVTDASENDAFKCARHEFQRSVPKAGGTAGTYERMAVGDDNDDTKNALAGLDLEKRGRPWFGKPAETGATIGLDWHPEDWKDVTKSDFLDILRNPAKRMILWVDDRNWYTNGIYWDKAYWTGLTVVIQHNRDTVHGDPAALGGDTGAGRGSYEDRDARVDKDVRDVARPWIPLQAQLRLLSKSETLASEVAAPAESDDVDAMRKAIGPIRVDWTFDEIEKPAPVVGVTANSMPLTDPLPVLDPEIDAILGKLYHPASVHGTYDRPQATRTRIALRWTLNEKKKDHDRKDVNKKSTYYNTPVDCGGIRSDTASQYYKAAFGLGDESLAPWKADGSDTRESVFTVVHDALGQGGENVFKKRLGLAGAYFHPSRIAGDGYQVRAEVRFDDKTDYKFPNAAVLEKRYEKLPQAHTAEFRLWRKTSMRGYINWGPTNTWAAGSVYQRNHFPYKGPDQWRAHYTGCYVHISNELGAGNDELAVDIADVFPLNTFKDLVIDALPAGDLRKDVANQHWINFSTGSTWPWWNHAQFGFPDPLPNKGELGQALGNAHVNLAFRMSLSFVKAVERLTGRMRGHIMVEYQTSPSVYCGTYECVTCRESFAYAQNSAANLHTGDPCPTMGCAGVLSEGRDYSINYACYPCNRVYTNPQDSIKGVWSGQPCPVCQTPLVVYMRTQGAVKARECMDNPHGGVLVHGVPSPSCGFPLGVFWNFSGTSSLWAHELGHNRHYEHAADAMQNPNNKATAEHDSPVNPIATWAPDEKDDNKRWDRACLMSYILSVKNSQWPPASTYDDQRDMPCFCFKCALKNRGWRITTLAMPPSDLQDPRP